MSPAGTSPKFKHGCSESVLEAVSDLGDGLAVVRVEVRQSPMLAVSI
jgi:hypothetical protein